jgi:hypothetical protein
VEYPAYVICVDGEPLVEANGEICLYQEGDDQILQERFMSMVYLSEDSSRITIKKFKLVPRTFESQVSHEEFVKKAQETRQVG